MEILTRGTPPNTKEHYTECRQCHSNLKFYASETVYHFDRRDGDYLSIRCPVCNHLVTCRP